MTDNKSDKPDGEASSATDTLKPDRAELVKEYGGKDGPEPTRYGDWEGTKGGLISDF